MLNTNVRVLLSPDGADSGGSGSVSHPLEKDMAHPAQRAAVYRVMQKEVRELDLPPDTLQKLCATLQIDYDRLSAKPEDISARSLCRLYDALYHQIDEREAGRFRKICESDKGRTMMAGILVTQREMMGLTVESLAERVALPRERVMACETTPKPGDAEDMLKIFNFLSKIQAEEITRSGSGDRTN